MIRYTANEIVKRAEQLADLQNSDFIGDDEKAYLLNEAWTGIYQKIIESNSKQWLKRITVTDGMRLPGDLYQISSVYAGNPDSPVMKGYDGYEIENKRIRLHFSTANVVYLEYYPVPETINFKTDDKYEVHPLSKPVIFTNEDNYIGEDNNIYIDGIARAAYKTDTARISVRNGSIGVGYTSYKQTETVKLLSTKFYDLKGNLVISRDISDGPLYIIGDTIQYDKVVGSGYIDNCIALISDTNEHVMYQIVMQLSYYDEKNVNRKIEIYDINGNKISPLVGSTVTEDKIVCSLYCRDDGLYFMTRDALSTEIDNFLTRCRGDITERFSTTPYEPLCFVDDRHILSRIITADDSSKYRYYLIGYGPDTKFDYPNNIYYTLLAYTLAVSFKIKQQGDTAALSAKLEEAWQRFYASVTNDSNSTYRIRNVNGGSMLWL